MASRCQSNLTTMAIETHLRPRGAWATVALGATTAVETAETADAMAHTEIESDKRVSEELSEPVRT